MVKTLFQYQGQINSADLNDAFGITNGYGPICGFGKGVIANDIITLTPYDNSESPLNGILSNSVIDKLCSHNANNIKFAIISRNGSLYYTDSDSLNITIEGVKGELNEVLVFAHRVKLNQPIYNPVEILAFWNNGLSFKPVYDKLYADEQTVGDTFNTNIDLSYQSLISQAKGSCDAFYNNEGDYTLIGIYGDDFIIVPYNGLFPNSLPLYPGLLDRISRHINRLSELYVELNGTGLSGLTLYDYITKLIPIGTIVLWAGSDIPSGWIEYVPARGRVVVGQIPGGVRLQNGETVFDAIGGVYKGVNEMDMRIELLDHYHTINYSTVRVVREVEVPEPEVTEGEGTEGNEATTVELTKEYAQVIQSITANSGTSKSNTSSPVITGGRLTGYNYTIMPSITLKYIQFVGFGTNS